MNRNNGEEWARTGLNNGHFDQNCHFCAESSFTSESSRIAPFATFVRSRQDKAPGDGVSVLPVALFLLTNSETGGIPGPEHDGIAYKAAGRRN